MVQRSFEYSPSSSSSITTLVKNSSLDSDDDEFEAYKAKSRGGIAYRRCAIKHQRYLIKTDYVLNWCDFTGFN